MPRPPQRRARTSDRRPGRTFGLLAIVVTALALLSLVASHVVRDDDAGPAETERAARPPSASQPSASQPSASQPSARERPPRTRRSHARRSHFALSRRAPIRLSHAEPVTTPGRVGAVDGIVVSRADGRAIAGATLVFDGVFDGGELRSIETHEDGRFHFEPPRAGGWELSLVHAPGYLPFAPELGHSPLVFQVRRGQSLRGARVYLEPEDPYTVVVRRGDGQPVADAEVEVLAEVGAALVPPAAPARTNERGEASVVAPDGAIVEARHPGDGEGRARIDVAARVSRRVEVTLDGGHVERASIAGRVVGEDGDAIADALVVASYDADNAADPRERSHPGGRARTDAEGRFSMEVDAGRYVVTARADGLAPAIARDVIAPASDVRLTLGRGSGVFGRVTDQRSGAPLASFVVSVTSSRGAVQREAVVVEVTFDPAGEYRIAALPEGTYFVSVAAQGYAPAPERRVEVRGEDVEASFELAAGGVITGHVVDAETARPLAGAEVSIEGRAGGESSVLVSATTDARGAFTLDGLGASTESIFVVAPEHHARVIGGLRVPSDAALELTVELTPVHKGEAPSIELAGIGAVLAAEEDVVVIGEVVASGGAAEAGLAAGDAILAVGGVSVGELGFAGTVQRIRGPEGSTVRLAIRKAGSEQTVDVDVVRRRIRAR